MTIIYLSLPHKKVNTLLGRRGTIPKKLLLALSTLSRGKLSVFASLPPARREAEKTEPSTPHFRHLLYFPISTAIKVPQTHLSTPATGKTPLSIFNRRVVCSPHRLFACRVFGPSSSTNNTCSQQRPQRLRALPRDAGYTTPGHHTRNLIRRRNPFRPLATVILKGRGGHLYTHVFRVASFGLLITTTRGEHWHCATGKQSCHCHSLPLTVFFALSGDSIVFSHSNSSLVFWLSHLRSITETSRGSVDDEYFSQLPFTPQCCCRAPILLRLILNTKLTKEPAFSIIHLFLSCIRLLQRRHDTGYLWVLNAAR